MMKFKWVVFFLCFTLQVNLVKAQVVLRGPYLQMVTPHSIIIRWQTDVECSSRVNYDINLNTLHSVLDTTLTTEHQVYLSGLDASTKYYYTIGSTDSVLHGDAQNYFVTSALTGSTSAVRVWVTGDFGNGSVEQVAVRDAYAQFAHNEDTHLWLWLGDNAYYTGTESEYQGNVFDKYPDQLKSIPLYPAIGNHDYGNAGYQTSSTLGLNFPYFSIFNVPSHGEAGGLASGTPKYYSFNYANIHFIALDSYGSYNDTGSVMYRWLEQDLNANEQRWTIAYFHHPPYTKGSHNSDTETELVNMRQNIVPLLEKFDVDLVLSGHSHSNERTPLIRGHYGLSQTFNPSMQIENAGDTLFKSSPFRGTVYAVCGTAGQNPGATQPGFPMACMQFNNISDNCSLVLDVEGDVLSCKYLSSSGNVVDRIVLKKSGFRQSGPLTQGGEKNFTVSYVNDQWELSYYLEKTTRVKIDLLNGLGQNIFSFPQIPEKQTRGFYRFNLLVKENNLRGGIYYIRMLADDEGYMQKVMLNGVR